MAKIKNGNTAAELRAKRREFERQLAGLVDEEERLDPVDDLDKAAQIAARATALGRAISTLDGRIAKADAEESAAAAEAFDAYALQRQLDAVAGAKAAAQALVDALGQLEAVRPFDAAIAEVSDAGAHLPTEVRAVLAARRDVRRLFVTLRSLAPEMVGAPRPPTLEEQHLAEAKRNLQRAGERLAWLKRTGAFDNREEAISGALAWQRTARARLAVLRGKDSELLDFDVELAALEREAPALVVKKSPAELEQMIEDRQRKQLAY